MIKSFIKKILGQPGKSSTSARRVTGQRVDVPPAEHGIDPRLLDDRAVKVVQTLQQAGFEAYIVGGAVRDLLLGLRPKDFDVATNATPEEVKGLFRRAFIIGRRFRIVHVVYGRGREHEVIEVSTFRAYLDNEAAEQVTGHEKTSKKALADKTHVVDASGRVLRDNVWGPQDQDAARRDFTVNAMYYDPTSGVVVDYHGGLQDARKKTLRMIGDPEVRYREDPVRIIRVVRFAAKLGFEIEPATRKPLRDMAPLLSNVPPSRLFDEMFKLLQTGHARASLAELRKQGLERGIFPVLDAVFDPARPQHPAREQFINLALDDTDRRVAEGKSVAPSFLLACMLWHDVLDQWQRNKAQGEAPFPALQQATDAVFNARVGDISGRGKLAADMREIWTMQPRFEKRIGSGPISLVEQPRFRAGFDFLRLRAQVGEIDEQLAQWWESFSLADMPERRHLMEVAKEQEETRRRLKPARQVPRGAVSGLAQTPVAPQGEEASDDAAPARKRRRRRRKPAGQGGDATGGGESA